jgi:hypothetical protein
LETRLLIEWQLLTWVRPVKLFAQDGQILILKLACGTSRRVYENEEASQSSTKQRSFASLDSMKAISGHREWVFPSIKAPLNHMHEQTANAAIIRMGFGGELVAHGMRSIAERLQRSLVSLGLMS